MCTLGYRNPQQEYEAEFRRYNAQIAKGRSPEDQIAELLNRHLPPAKVSGESVRALIYSEWETLTKLAHAIHDNDRRKRDRRS